MHAQATISASVSPAALAGGGGPGSVGSPYAVFVRIQGWTAAAGTTAYVKIYSGSSNEYMWTGSDWSSATAFDAANQPVVPINASGNWSGWIYAKHNDLLGTSASVRAGRVGDPTITRLTSALPAFNVLNVSVSGNGGWISRVTSAAVNRAIGAFAGGTLVGTYRTEENGIAEGYALGAGGFRIAVPAGTVDSLVAWNDDGSVFSSLVGPWSVNPGVETDATTGGTTIGTGRASILPPTLPGGTVAGITMRVYGEGSALIRAVRFLVPQRWSWSHTPADVVAPGTVAVEGDSITVSGLFLAGTDSFTVQVQNLVPFDSTGSYVVRTLTGTAVDSLFPFATQPSVFVYSTPLPISTVKENDPNGVPLRINSLVTVRGVVTVANEFGGPSYLQDNSGGVAVFGSTFSTAVSVGDEVVVSGIVQPFNGLTELTSPTIHKVVGRGNVVDLLTVTAAEVAADGQGGVEVFEGRLVRLNGVTVAGSGTWAYQNYNVADASGSVQIRIDNNTELIGTPVPAGAFDLVGVVGQFIGTSPYIGGYQVMPRRPTDVISSGPILASFPVETAITPTSLTIGWKTVYAGTSHASYGKTAALELGTVSDPTPATLHSIKLDGLSAATIYYVRAFSTSGQDTSFATPLVASTASPPSASGMLNVYFNQSVDTTVAWSERALGRQNLAERLITRITSARRSVDVAVYSLSGTPGPGSDIANALVAARARGVSVRVVCEGDNRNTAPFTILANGGVPVIDDRFDAVNAGQGLMHNKFFVIDARGGAAESVWVVTGSWNPTTPGTFSDYQNVLEIQDPALAGAYEAEFNEMWGSATDTPNATLSRFGARKTDNTPHRFVIGGTPVECYFSPTDRTTSHIQAAIDGARHSVAFGVLTFTRSDLRTSIVAQQNAARMVRGIMDNNTDSGNQYAALRSAGVDVLLKPASDSLFHHKYLVVDGENPSWSSVVVTGSHNWSNSAETSNNENTLILQSGRIAGLYLQEFSARYRQFGGKDPIVVAVANEGGPWPAQFELMQNYPNPFNSISEIRYQIPDFGPAKLAVYDLLGREVAVLVDREVPRGSYSVRFDAGGLASGVYLYRLTAGSTVLTRKMILMR
jgi:phosphatidylserine/phosphatidylglycerophosphate/cardiolipin synthase-like enzyme